MPFKVGDKVIRITHLGPHREFWFKANKQYMVTRILGDNIWVDVGARFNDGPWLARRFKLVKIERNLPHWF